MNDLAFADAARPMPAVILRLRLKPYSIGHELLLQGQRNPIIGNPSEFDSLPMKMQRLALVGAVMICERSWDEQDNPHRWLRLWGWLLRKANWKSEVSSFRNYRINGSTFPALLPIPKNEEGRTPGGPFIARLLLLSGINYDCPLGLAQWIYSTHQECEGNCKIANETDSAVEGMVSDILKEKGDKCPQ